MRENALISVIVPIYKVERYLNKCLDSIVNQTYKELEIILVDDGSPDGCPKICDEWGLKDSRIKVIHKANAGLGNDVIIGAGSVVAKDCESGWVYAGNPAKKIISIQDYLKKRQGAQLREAKELWVSYKNRYGKRPTREVFHEYFMLFESSESLDEKQIEKMKLCGNYEDSIDYMNNNKAPFCSFEEFALYCEEKEIDKNRVKMDECK